MAYTIGQIGGGPFAVPYPRPTQGAGPTLNRTGTMYIASASAGHIMTCDAGVWAGPNQTVGYAWYVGTTLAGMATVTNATNASFSVSAAQSAQTARCKVTNTNKWGSNSVWTDVVRIIA